MRGIGFRATLARMLCGKEEEKKSGNNNYGITRRNVPTAELGFLSAATARIVI
jgi:hypothetical protein